MLACSDVYMRSAHDADYRTAKKDWDTFCESLTEKIIERDDTIPELPVKDVVRQVHGAWGVLADHAEVFRIHRDARFSKDPTPYKVFVVTPKKCTMG